MACFYQTIPGHMKMMSKNQRKRRRAINMGGAGGGEERQKWPDHPTDSEKVWRGTMVALTRRNRTGQRMRSGRTEPSPLRRQDILRTNHRIQRARVSSPVCPCAHRHMPKTKPRNSDSEPRGHLCSSPPWTFKVTVNVEPWDLPLNISSRHTQSPAVGPVCKPEHPRADLQHSHKSWL